MKSSALFRDDMSATAPRQEIGLSRGEFSTLNAKYGHPKREGETDAEFFTLADSEGKRRENTPFVGENACVIRA